MATLHAGGNDLANDIDIETIAGNLGYVGLELKSRGVKHVAISGMCPRKDLKDEIPKLNNAIKGLCRTYNLDYIDNTNIKYRYKDGDGYFRSHLSYDRVHLNYDGVEILESNYISYLRNLKAENEE